jgi:acetylornithine deacetylase/succinyl-diaminopimelate desuccinylase-like protein
MDTSNPPGNESLVVDYLKSVLEREASKPKSFANDPKRANLVARLRGQRQKASGADYGAHRCRHVDPTKWKHPPFSATREGGYVYARGRR